MSGIPRTPRLFSRFFVRLINDALEVEWDFLGRLNVGRPGIPGRAILETVDALAGFVRNIDLQRRPLETRLPWVGGRVGYPV